MAFFFTACASSGPDRTNLSYDANPFWAFEGKPPSHPDKKAHVDFFDKVCSGAHGESYDCHYTDDP